MRLLRATGHTLGDHIRDVDNVNQKDDYAIQVSTMDTNQTDHFVGSVKATNGGDEPEAYEDALRYLSLMAWRSNAQKLAFFIGDAMPHEPDACPEGIDWRQEVDRLAKLDVRVHGLQLPGLTRPGLTRPGLTESTNFFTRLCEVTGGRHKIIDNTSDISRIIIDWLMEQYETVA